MIRAAGASDYMPPSDRMDMNSYVPPNTNPDSLAFRQQFPQTYAQNVAKAEESRRQIADAGRSDYMPPSDRMDMDSYVPPNTNPDSLAFRQQFPQTYAQNVARRKEEAAVTRAQEERKEQLLKTVRQPGYGPPAQGNPMGFTPAMEQAATRRQIKEAGSDATPSIVINDDDDTKKAKDTYCCTAAWQRKQMSITEIKELRRWHNKQSQLWRDGYDIWGKWVADNLVEKSDWSASVVRDVHRAFVKKEYTFKSIIGIIVIGPGVYAAGLYKRIRGNGRATKTNS
jgi:hypothetical protein